LDKIPNVNMEVKDRSAVERVNPKKVSDTQYWVHGKDSKGPLLPQ